MVLLGIDVSKGRLDCALLADEGGSSLGGRAFPNDAGGTGRAASWASRVSGAAAADTHVILEATAAYHEPAAHQLAALGMRVSVVNPARVRSFAKGLGILGKTDRIDARLLARYGQLVRPKAWQPRPRPSPTSRRLWRDSTTSRPTFGACSCWMNSPQKR